MSSWRRHGLRREVLVRALACGGRLLSSSGWGVAAVSLATAGCATRDATASALTTAGAAAVIVGAAIAADSHCYQAGHGAAGAYCSPGLSKSSRNAGTALAIAGVGVAAAGYALQPRGPDQLGPAPSPRAPTRPYRLLRRPVVQATAGGASSSAASGAGDAAGNPEAAEPVRSDPSVAPLPEKPPAASPVEPAAPLPAAPLPAAPLPAAPLPAAPLPAAPPPEG